MKINKTPSANKLHNELLKLDQNYADVITIYWIKYIPQVLYQK